MSIERQGGGRGEYNNPDEIFPEGVRGICNTEFAVNPDSVKSLDGKTVKEFKDFLRRQFVWEGVNPDNPRGIEKIRRPNEVEQEVLEKAIVLVAGFVKKVFNVDIGRDIGRIRVIEGEAPTRISGVYLRAWVSEDDIPNSAEKAIPRELLTYLFALYAQKRKFVIDDPKLVVSTNETIRQEESSSRYDVTNYGGVYAPIEPAYEGYNTPERNLQYVNIVCAHYLAKRVLDSFEEKEGLMAKAVKGVRDKVSGAFRQNVHKPDEAIGLLDNLIERYANSLPGENREVNMKLAKHAILSGFVDGDPEAVVREVEKTIGEEGVFDELNKQVMALMSR